MRKIKVNGLVRQKDSEEKTMEGRKVKEEKERKQEPAVTLQRFQGRG